MNNKDSISELNSGRVTSQTRRPRSPQPQEKQCAGSASAANATDPSRAAATAPSSSTPPKEKTTRATDSTTGVSNTPSASCNTDTTCSTSPVLDVKVDLLAHNPVSLATANRPNPRERKDLLAFSADSSTILDSEVEVITSTPRSSASPLPNITLPDFPHLESPPVRLGGIPGDSFTSTPSDHESRSIDSHLESRPPSLQAVIDNIASRLPNTSSSSEEDSEIQFKLPKPSWDFTGSHHNPLNPATQQREDLCAANWSARIDAAYDRWRNITAPHAQAAPVETEDSQVGINTRDLEDPDKFLQRITTNLDKWWDRPHSTGRPTPRAYTSESEDDLYPTNPRGVVILPTTVGTPGGDIGAIPVNLDRIRSLSDFPRRKNAPPHYRLGESIDSATVGEAIRATSKIFDRCGTRQDHQSAFRTYTRESMDRTPSNNNTRPQRTGNTSPLICREDRPPDHDQQIRNNQQRRPHPTEGATGGTMETNQTSEMAREISRQVVDSCTGFLRQHMEDRARENIMMFENHAREMEMKHQRFREESRRDFMEMERQYVRSNQLEQIMESSFSPKIEDLMARSRNASRDLNEDLLRNIRGLTDQIHDRLDKDERRRQESTPPIPPPPPYPSPIISSTQDRHGGRQMQGNQPNPYPRPPPRSMNYDPDDQRTPNRRQKSPLRQAWAGPTHLAPSNTPEMTTPPPPPRRSVVDLHQMAAPVARRYQEQQALDLSPGSVIEGVYMATPNRPRNDIQRSNPRMGVTQLYPTHGPPHGGTHHLPETNPLRAPYAGDLSQHNATQWPDQTGTAGRMSSAQLSSFNKPKPFGRPTPYRSASRFLSEYKFYIQAMHPYDEKMQALCFYGYLEDRASQWYFVNVMDKPISINRDMLFAAFLQRFGAEDPETLIKGYRNRRQKKDESVESYCSDMISLLSNSQLDEQTQVDYLLNGLRPEIGNIVRMDTPKTIMEVERMSIKQELSIEALRGRSKTPPPQANINEIKPFTRSSWSDPRDTRTYEFDRGNNQDRGRWRDRVESRLPSAGYDRNYNSRYNLSYDNRSFSQNDRQNGYSSDRDRGRPYQREDRSNSYGYYRDSRYRSPSNGDRSGSFNNDNNRGRPVYRDNRNRSYNSDNRNRSYNSDNRNRSYNEDDRNRSYRDNRNTSFNENNRNVSFNNNNRSGPQRRDRSESAGRNSNRSNREGNRPSPFNNNISRSRENRRNSDGGQQQGLNTSVREREPTPFRENGRRDRSRSSDSRSGDRSRTRSRSADDDRSRPSSGNEE